MNYNKISWSKLREWNGSVNRAFELLCSQLAQHEPVKNKKRFASTGLRDAGVECYWILNDGSEIGWQAKYFLQTMQESELGQLDNSVKTAIKKHPSLKEYIICIPHDLDDPRIKDQVSEKDRWDKRVLKWKKWAVNAGLSIEFSLWGEDQILERLSKEENSGKRYFWFNENEFSNTWFEKHLDSQIAKASHRYSPSLHIDLPLFDNVDSFLRKGSLYDEFKYHRVELKSDGRYVFQSLKKLPLDQKLIEHSEQFFKEILSELELYKSFTNEVLIFKKLSDSIRDLENDLEELSNSVDSLAKKNDSVGRELFKLKRSLREALYFLTGNSVELANSKCLTINGSGGSGKTHLICDLCNKRNLQGLPTLLFFGEEFTNADPWTQIVNRLQVNCKRDELLESLNTIAFLNNSYGIIAIDALNEGDGKRIWKSELLSMLSILEEYPYLKLLVSIRSDYVSAILDHDSLKNNTSFVVHNGFQSVEFQATKKFFDSYQIERPKIPLLVPEFSNPLFLKLFCEAISNGKLKVSDISETGVSTVYSAFLDGVNNKLSGFDQLDYDKADNRVRRAVHKLSEFKFLNTKHAVLRLEAGEILQRIHTSNSYENSLLNKLLSEGILKETILYNNLNDDWDEAVDFAYERLSDYLRAEFLVYDFLEETKTETDLVFSKWFSKRTELDIWGSGVFEALSILCPEKLGFEFIEQFPREKIFQAVSPFIKSLIWRNPKSITDTTIDCINKYIIRSSNKYLIHELFDAFLLISSNPSHRLNSKGLHDYLTNHSLPKREAIWQDYLKMNYYEEGVINRVLDWSLSKHDKSNISDESLTLYGVVLCWFFTSTNRELRDKATKGLTNLFLNRPILVLKFLEVFSECDDPYLTERLYASILGICQLSSQEKEVILISDYVFSTFFEKGTPTTNILIRDYAKGIVGSAERFKKLSAFKRYKITPPYNSGWTKSIPSISELIKSNPFDQSKAEYSNEERALGRIFHSVLHDDFSRYIIGTNSWTFNWKPIRLNDKDKSEKDIVMSFLGTLTERQWDLFSSLLDIIKPSSGIHRSNENDDFEFDGKIYSGKKLLRMRNTTENKFIRSLGKKKILQYEELTKRYITNNGYSETSFNLNLAQRWILNRVFDLGWDEKLHGDFDSSFSSFDRSEHRLERIGKKYQWIAYFEFLGLVSDNFVFDSAFSDSDKYLGTWQISVRDIDPSMINLTNKSDKYFSDLNWWNNVKYEEWINPSDWKKWMTRTDDIPDPKSLMIAINPIDGSEWYSFHNSATWRNILLEEKHTSEYQELWYSITPFFVERKNISSVVKVIEDPSNKLEFPKIYRLEEIFYGEQYHSSAFKDIYRRSRPSDWIKETETFKGASLPAPVMLPFYEYFKGTSQDHSLNDGIKIYIPVKTVSNDLQLRINEQIGYFYNASNKLVAYNPHLYESGESVCLFDKKMLDAYLKEKNWTILWKVYGEKIEQQSVRKNGFNGRLIIKGHYYLDERLEIQGKLYPKFDLI